MITKKKEWITTKELAKLKGVCDRAVRKSINDNKYVVRKVSRSYEILVTSLEENVREKLTEDEEKLIPKIEENYIVPEDQKQLALAKYDLVKKWNEYRYGKKDRTKAGQEFIESYNLELLYKELFQKIGKVAIGTIYDWDKKLRNYDDNWHCLIKNYSFGVKTNKKSGLSEKEEEIFLSILLHPNQIKIGKAIKLTKTILEQRGVKKFSCDMTYRRFINNYKKEHYDTWVFAREGHKALHDKVLPYITRDISKLEVGDVIIGDGHKLAFQVINPYTGNPTRATMVAYQEWKSGAMVGFEIMLEENKQCVASALRNAIITLGKVPKYVYHDNGKSFKAKYFIENGLSGIFANLGIEAIFAKAYNAKAKPIERFFKEFQETFEQLMPSYTGISIEQKPAKCKRNEKFHQKIANTYIPTIQEVFECVKKWLNFHYAQPCPHVKCKTIGEVLESGKGVGVNLDTLDDLMMATEIKTVNRCNIRFLKTDYFAYELYGYQGQVLIKYSLFDLSYIKAYKPNGEFICIANRVIGTHPLANEMGEIKDIEDLKQKTKLKKQLEKRTQENYIRELKRQKAYFPMLTNDLEQKRETDELKQFCIEVKETPKEETPTYFQNPFDRLDYLSQKDNLTQEEKDWIKEFKDSKAYKDIYEDEEAV